jgi:hypothetical protein
MDWYIYAQKGMMFYNFLTELASYGFFVISNGNPAGAGSSGGSSMMSMGRGDGLIKSINWVGNNTAELKKYGNVDVSQIIAAGQSCGTMQSVSKHVIGRKRWGEKKLIMSLVNGCQSR